MSKSGYGEDSLEFIILSLTDQLGRLPTEDEVINFIHGDEEERKRIWNQEEE